MVELSTFPALVTHYFQSVTCCWVITLNVSSLCAGAAEHRWPVTVTVTGLSRSLTTRGQASAFFIHLFVYLFVCSFVSSFLCSISD